MTEESSHVSTCINSARANICGLCSGYSHLSHMVEVFTSVSAGNAESKIWESKRAAFNFKN